MAFFRLFFFVVSLFFIGCQSTTDDSNTGGGSLSASMSISNGNVEYSNGFISQYKGDLKMVENNSFYTSAVFSNIVPSLDSGSECNITGFSIPKTDIKSGEEVPFVITTNNECRNINTLKFTATETASYIDTATRHVQSTTSFEKDINISSIVTDDKAEVNYLVVSPSNIQVIKGLKDKITIIALDKNSNPVPSSKIKISVPVNKDGEIFGSFDNYEVTTKDNGQAMVIYTAPTNAGEIDDNVSVRFSVVNSLVSDSINLIFSKGNSSTDYDIEVNAPDFIEVDSSGNLLVNIVEAKSLGKQIEDKNVIEVNVTSLVNGFISFEGNGSEGYQYNSASYKNIKIFSGKKSGIDVIRVSACVSDGDGNITITKDIPVTISSGPISAMSINYVDSSYDSENALFVDNYSIHAVDRFGNPANAGSKLYVGVVNDVKIDGNGNELYLENNGAIRYDSVRELTEFKLLNSNYKFDTVKEGDNVVILASKNRHDPAYLGGWIVEEVVNDSTIRFSSKYLGEIANNLKFVLGNEYRYDSCEDTVRVADFDSSDKTYVTDEGGNAKLKLRYDSYLIGKDVYIYANSYSDKRVGIALKRKLWGTGIPIPGAKTCSAPKDSSKKCSFDFTLYPNNSPEVLRNVKIGGFSLNGSCKIEYEDLETGCDGTVSVEVNTTANSSCSVTWDGSIQYEH